MTKINLQLLFSTHKVKNKLYQNMTNWQLHTQTYFQQNARINDQEAHLSQWDALAGRRLEHVYVNHSTPFLTVYYIIQIEAAVSEK